MICSPLPRRDIQKGPFWSWGESGFGLFTCHLFFCVLRLGSWGLISVPLYLAWRRLLVLCFAIVRSQFRLRVVGEGPRWTCHRLTRCREARRLRNQSTRRSYNRCRSTNHLLECRPRNETHQSFFDLRIPCPHRRRYDWLWRVCGCVNLFYSRVEWGERKFHTTCLHRGDFWINILSSYHEFWLLGISFFHFRVFISRNLLLSHFPRSP